MTALMLQVKGASSRFLNAEYAREGIPQQFVWQDGYGATSVSPSGVETVVAYIRRQKEHHTADYDPLEGYEWVETS